MVSNEFRGFTGGIGTRMSWPIAISSSWKRSVGFTTKATLQRQHHRRALGCGFEVWDCHFSWPTWCTYSITSLFFLIFLLHMQTRLFNLLPHRPIFNLWNSTWCPWDQIGGKLQKVPLQACHRSSEWENALDFFVEMQQRNLQQEPKRSPDGCVTWCEVLSSRTKHFLGGRSASSRICVGTLELYLRWPGPIIWSWKIFLLQVDFRGLQIVGLCPCLKPRRRIQADSTCSSGVRACDLGPTSGQVTKTWRMHGTW